MSPSDASDPSACAAPGPSTAVVAGRTGTPQQHHNSAPVAYADDPFAVMLKLETADLLPRQKTLVNLVLWRSFKPSPEDPKKGDPLARWVVIDLPTLSVIFEDHGPHLSDLLIQLVKLHVLDRRPAPEQRYVRVLAPSEWAREVVDPALARAARTERYTREGSGAPRAARSARPEVPLAERTGDRFRNPLITEDHVHDWIAGDNGVSNPRLVAECWRVVEHFQTIQDEAFKVAKWMPRLVSLLTEERWTAAEITRTLSALQKQYKPKSLWSYFLKALSNKDAAPAPTRTSSLPALAAPTPPDVLDPRAVTTVHSVVDAVNEEDPTHAQGNPHHPATKAAGRFTPRATTPRPIAGTGAGGGGAQRHHGAFDDLVVRPKRSTTPAAAAIVDAVDAG